MSYSTKTLPPGGTEKERESNAKVEYLSLSKTAVVGQFSNDAPPNNPQVLSSKAGLTFEDVFNEFKPVIDVNLKDKDGEFHEGVKVNFKKMQDFNPKEITNNLPIMRDLKESEDGYNTMLRQLKNNIVFNRLLKKPEARQSLINLFSSLVEELESNEK